MPWNDQGNGEGPWGKGKSQGPWGGGKRGGPKPPDLEELIKKGQESLRRMMPGGGGGNTKTIVYFAVVVGLLLWLSTGFYRVSEGELGVELRFGEMKMITQPGLRYHFPAPIEAVIVTKVSQVNQVDSGVQVKSESAFAGEETADQMLTGDENIVTLNFSVLWFIKDVKQYLFNDPDPRRTVKFAAESAVREVIAQTTIADALTKGKDKIIIDAQRLLQKMLDEYKIGIEVQQVRLQRVNPPDKVIDAFRDVQRARADRESKINESRAYQNSIIPEARGQGQQIIQNAEAYKEAVVADAKGQSQRFLALLKEYQIAPEVTRKRLYIDFMSKVLQGVNKVLIDSNSHGMQGVLPYLPLPALKTDRQPAEGATK